MCGISEKVDHVGGGRCVSESYEVVEAAAASDQLESSEQQLTSPHGAGQQRGPGHHQAGRAGRDAGAAV